MLKDYAECRWPIINWIIQILSEKKNQNIFLIFCHFIWPHSYRPKWLLNVFPYNMIFCTDFLQKKNASIEWYWKLYRQLIPTWFLETTFPKLNFHKSHNIFYDLQFVWILKIMYRYWWIFSGVRTDFFFISVNAEGQHANKFWYQKKAMVNQLCVRNLKVQIKIQTKYPPSKTSFFLTL